MVESTGAPLCELRVDGGPTRNRYLMQMQSDLLGIPVRIPDSEELSGAGAAYAAGLSVGLYNENAEANQLLCRNARADSQRKAKRLAARRSCSAETGQLLSRSNSFHRKADFQI